MCLYTGIYCHLQLHYIYIYLFNWCFYPKWLTIAINVRACAPLEQLGVKCLAQGHIGVSQWIRTMVSHTKGMCLILCHLGSGCLKIMLRNNMKRISSFFFKVYFLVTFLNSLNLDNSCLWLLCQTAAKLFVSKSTWKQGGG